MNEIRVQILITQCQIKGLYQLLKQLAEIPCPHCGKTVIVSGTMYYPWPGNIAVPLNDGTNKINYILCETCNGTGLLAGSRDDILDLNRLVGR